MIKSGVNIVYNKRFEKLAEDPRFLKRIFHPFELKNKKKLAGIFVLKEATMKALGKKINWLDLEIKSVEGEKPEVRLSKEITPHNLVSIDGSVSHDGDYTIGFVVIELNIIYIIS